MRIVIIDGHPDAAGGHLCEALADAYAQGAADAGHAVTRLSPAIMTFGFLQSQAEQEKGVPEDDIRAAQADIAACDHLVLIYPLWLGGMPARLKAFWEQLARPGFAYDPSKGPFGGKLLEGRSARVIVTMGMPSWWFRLAYRSASLTALRIGILHFVGIRPVRATLIGQVAAPDFNAGHWLETVRRLGRGGR